MARPITGNLGLEALQNILGQGGGGANPAQAMAQAAQNIGQAGATTAQIMSRRGNVPVGSPGEAIGAGLASMGQSIGEGLAEGGRMRERERIRKEENARQDKMILDANKRQDEQDARRTRLELSLAKLNRASAQDDAEAGRRLAEGNMILQQLVGIEPWQKGPDGEFILDDKGNRIPNENRAEVERLYYKTLEPNWRRNLNFDGNVDLIAQQYLDSYGGGDKVSPQVREQLIKFKEARNQRIDHYDRTYKTHWAGLPLWARPIDPTTGLPQVNAKRVEQEGANMVPNDLLWRTLSVVRDNEEGNQADLDRFQRLVDYAGGQVTKIMGQAESASGDRNANIEALAGGFVFRAVHGGQLDPLHVIGSYNPLVGAMITEAFRTKADKSDSMIAAATAERVLAHTTAAVATRLEGIMRPEVRKEWGLPNMTDEQVKVAYDRLSVALAALSARHAQVRESPGYMSLKALENVDDLRDAYLKLKIVPKGHPMAGQPGFATSQKEGLTRVIAEWTAEHLSESAHVLADMVGSGGYLLAESGETLPSVLTPAPTTQPAAAQRSEIMDAARLLLGAFSGGGSNGPAPARKQAAVAPGLPPSFRMAPAQAWQAPPPTPPAGPPPGLALQAGPDEPPGGGNP